MSERAMWKMLQLLNRSPRGEETRQALGDAGIDCYMDTIQLLIDSGAVQTNASTGSTRSPNDRFWLSQTARQLLNDCIVSNKWLGGTDMQVDSPRAFVVMPFSQRWSDDVYHKMICPAVKKSGLECIRGDTPPRVADLATNIWNAILHAGIVIAEVSEPNPNVFYELGLVHALGKPAFLLVQTGTDPPIDAGSPYAFQSGAAPVGPLPADFGGAHYYQYDRSRLEMERDRLSEILIQWAAQYCVRGVQALLT